ncbi:MAG: pitrilysin family protein [Campylobacterota bacterium]|nr:pitrilysin family protein [Campylobacterota bacterium]
MAATIKHIKHNDTNIPTIFEQHKTLPIFNLQLVFKNSGYINDKNNPGLTNLTAKILNEGTKKDGSINFARKLENKAISIHTATGLETFVIEVSCLKQEYKTALKYLKELLQDPNITNKSLDKIKTLQISKLTQKENDFDFVASNNLNSIIYKDSALEFSSIGDIDSLKNISSKNISSNLQNILNTNNLIITVGGDIQFKEFKNEIKDILSLIKRTTKEKKIKKIDISKKTENKTELKETQQSYIYFASPFYIDHNSKDNYKAKVASFILGGSGFGSRLMEEIRVKNGLAYSAYGNISNKKSYSHFKGYLQTKLDNTTKAKDMVEAIVNEFVENGVTKKELEAAKNFLKGSEPLRTETFSQRLNRSFMLYYNGLDFDYPTKELELIDNLTVKELNRFIKSHKEIKNLSFSIVTK